jgi:hypothetical protein
MAAKTPEWFNAHRSLARTGRGHDRKPSLSQWLDLVGELEASRPTPVASRLNPRTAGSKSWKHRDARAILEKLNEIQTPERGLYARLFVRWLRAEVRSCQGLGAR